MKEKINANKILLINCALDKGSRKKIKNVVSSPSLGLLSIASVLIMHGYKVKVLDFFAENISKEDYISILETWKPNVIGFSVYTRTVPFLYRILNITKQSNFTGTIVAGGPHPTFNQEEMLKDLGVDYVIMGEGEFTFLKLLEHINFPQQYPLKNIKGISYMRGNELIINKQDGYIEKLDILPLQPIDLVDVSKYTTPSTIVSSRGCHGNCIYCASRSMSGNNYRMRSAENIICEMLYLKEKLKTNKITFLDDTFTADKNRFDRFIKLIKSLGNEFEYRIESRGDTLSKDILEELKTTNCKVIHVGIESGSQDVIDKIGKKINLVETIDMLYYGNELGIHMVASFIIGHYCDDKNTIKQTIDLMKQLKKAGIEVSVASCTPFPGTALYNHREKLKVKLLSHTWQDYDFSNVIIETDHLKNEELRDLLFEAIMACM